MIQDPPQAPPCPICRRPSQKAYQPFCSRRCADVDLQRWFSGGYVVPGAPPEDEETDAPDLGGDGEEG